MINAIYSEGIWLLSVGIEKKSRWDKSIIEPRFFFCSDSELQKYFIGLHRFLQCTHNFLGARNIIAPPLQVDRKDCATESSIKISALFRIL